MKTNAKDIMSTQLLVASEDMTVEEALKLLVNNGITGLPVVNKKGAMVGVLSEYDIIAQVGKNKKLSPALFAKKISFSDKTDFVSEETSLNEILDRFINTKFRRLPVVDQSGKLVGIITRRDIMRLLYYRAKF